MGAVMSILSHVRGLIDEWRYAGVPAALPKKAPRGSQAGDLTTSQIEWCDENLCLVAGEKKFKKYREQAIAARRAASP